MNTVCGSKEALPPLPHIAYIRHIRSNPHSTIARLADLIQTAALEL